MMTNTELQRHMEAVSLQFFKRPFTHQARFNARLRTTGGRYLLASHAIEMNLKYLNAYGLDYFTAIMRHELCHYHLHLEGKGYQHRDTDFRQLLKEVDAPRFCHALPEEKAGHLYQCLTCKQKIFRQRRFDVKKYRCGNCGGKWRYLQKTTIKPS